jgi:flagellar basal-body rod protein FlgB
MDLTGPQTSMLSRLLAATELRQSALSANLANVNTPGYKRQVVEFESLLREEFDRGGVDLHTIQPEIVTDFETEGRPDGNNVSMESELGAMRENRLLYETYATILGNHFALLDAAISGRV